MLSITRKSQDEEVEGYDTLEMGIYRVRLTNVEEVAGKQGYDGKEPENRFMWTFQVVEPGFESHPNGKDRLVRAWTSQRTGVNKTTGKPARAIQFVEGILGRSLPENETLNLADLLGTEANAMLSVSADGKWNNIESLAPVRREAPKALAAAHKPTVPQVTLGGMKGPTSEQAAELDFDDLEDAEPNVREALGFPRRRQNALAECRAMEFWTPEFEDAWRVQIHGEERARVPFAKMTSREQGKEVKTLEGWAAGNDLPF